MTNLASDRRGASRRRGGDVEGETRTTYGELRSLVAGCGAGWSAGRAARRPGRARVPNGGVDFAAAYLAVLGVGRGRGPLQPDRPAPSWPRSWPRRRPARRRRRRGDPRDPDELAAPTPPSRRPRRRRPRRAHVHRGTAGAPRAAMLTPRQPARQHRQVQRPPRPRSPTRRRRARRAAAVPHLRAQRRARPRRCAPARRSCCVERFDPSARSRPIARPRRHGRRRRAPDVGGLGRAAPTPPPPTRSRPCASPCRARPRCREDVAAAFEDRFGVDAPRGLRPHRGVARSSRRRLGGDARAGLDRRAARRRRGAPGRRRRRRRAGRRPRRDLGAGPERVQGLLGRRRGRPRARSTPDGWLRTGDIAVADDDGYLYLVDRAKDLIIVSGFNVFPAEVEEVLLEHPASPRPRSSASPIRTRARR